MVSQAASGLAWGYKAVSGPRPGCNELQGFGTNMWDLIRGHQDWWLHIRHVYFQVGSCKEGGFSCMKAPGLPPSCMYFYKIVNCAYFLIIPCIHWEYMCKNYMLNGPLGSRGLVAMFLPIYTDTSSVYDNQLHIQEIFIAPKLQLNSAIHRRNINPRHMIQVKPRT